MQTKTYFATSIPAALEVARKELGSDAMLVSSRPSPAEVRAFGKLEVTFAFDPKPENPPDGREGATGRLFAPVSKLPETAGTGRYSRSELDDLRQQIATLRSEIARPGHATTAGVRSFGEHFSAASAALAATTIDEPNPLAGRLCGGGLDPGTARDIAVAAARHPGEPGSALLRELISRIPVKGFAPLQPGERRTLAFIGPPGRGKTTTLVKVAVRHGLAKRVPVRIYSGGAHGVASQEQMARFAALLGVPFQAFESLESLHLALQGDASKGLVLIDTPGLSPAESAELDGMAAFFGRLPGIEKHLVLRADARTADMARAVARFAPVGPNYLLFTGLDEASAPGAMLDTLIRSGIPAVFAGIGQQIPDDLEAFDASRLAGEICGGNRLAAGAAA